MKLGILHYNTKTEEGEVKWEPTMDLTKPDVVMLDTLGDWISVLTLAHEDMHKLIYPENK